MSSRGLPDALMKKVDEYVDSLAPQIQLRIATELKTFCRKERGFRGPGFWSEKLTECLALPERQSASAMVLTKPNPTMWSIKKEVLASARTTRTRNLHTSNTVNLLQPHYFHRIQGAVFLTILLFLILPFYNTVHLC
jgi:hypothetical protein